MKITVNVDCTPEEARDFLGLPDVKAMQEALMSEVKDRMLASVPSMAPEDMFRLWFPANLKGFEQWRDLIFAQMQGSKPE